MPVHHAVEAGASWLRALRVYTAVLVPGMLAWEAVQLPLYTLWRDGTPGEIAFAVVHCTLGDGLIGVAALAWALFMVGDESWPAAGSMRVLVGPALAIQLGDERFTGTGLGMARIYSEVQHKPGAAPLPSSCTATGVPARVRLE